MDVLHFLVIACSMDSKCPFCKYPCHAICGKTYIVNTFIDMIVSLVISRPADSFPKSSRRLRAPFPFPPNLKLSHHTWFGRILDSFKILTLYQYLIIRHQRLIFVLSELCPKKTHIVGYTGWIGNRTKREKNIEIDYNWFSFFKFVWTLIKNM